MHLFANKTQKPDYFLNAAIGTPIETIGNILIKVDPILEEVQPDAFLVLGDTNSCLCAIAAKRRKIPIFHMEAGNRCFDQRVPEETNRRIVDHIADINLPYSDIAREYLLNEGIPADRIIKTGSPMFEVLKNNEIGIKTSPIVENLDLKPENYMVVSVHREENVTCEKNFLDLMEALNTIAQKYQMPIIMSTHPRTRKQVEAIGLTLHPLIRMLKPLGFNDYIKLQMESKVVLSDSGTISEEASILGFKALNIRQAHERPEAMEEAIVILTGLHQDRILQALAVLEGYPAPIIHEVSDYTKDNVSAKVVRLILSYTDYVNRVVWRK